MKNSSLMAFGLEKVHRERESEIVTALITFIQSFHSLILKEVYLSGSC
jgi:hypothetical protein